jgi:type IV pilus assembly protein PilA
MRNNKGFTLMELVVVIAVLAILVAIALPRLAGFRDSATVKADIAAGKTVATAAATLVASGAIPYGTEETVLLTADTTKESGGYAGQILGYLDNAPKNRYGSDWCIKITDDEITVFTGAGAEAANQVYPQYGSNYSTP